MNNIRISNQVFKITSVTIFFYLITINHKFLVLLQVNFWFQQYELSKNPNGLESMVIRLSLITARIVGN